MSLEQEVIISHLYVAQRYEAKRSTRRKGRIDFPPRVGQNSDTRAPNFFWFHPILPSAPSRFQKSPFLSSSARRGPWPRGRRGNRTDRRSTDSSAAVPCVVASLKRRSSRPASDDMGGRCALTADHDRSYRSSGKGNKMLQAS
jgi:hypothetical protein